MKLSDFHYDLPDHLIAQQPLASRTDSRLLIVNGDALPLEHTQFSQITRQLRGGDLLVVNDTRVVPARMLGTKATGGKVEIMLERVLGEHRLLAKTRASKSPKPGTTLVVGGEARLTVSGRQGEFFVLELEPDTTVGELLQRHGQVPLPPYITRLPTESDLERYQTVYAKEPGAVAAPTAGLHFDEKLLSELAGKGVDSVSVTLHVGAGTFQPVRVENPDEHEMHAEFVEVSPEAVSRIIQAREAGGRIIAVGTTSVRCLETASAQGVLAPYTGDTQLFIRPGYKFNVVDGLITNFHLPESTLLMLVAAFGGYPAMMDAYREAVDKEYRFFSYGDAMLIWPGSE